MTVAKALRQRPLALTLALLTITSLAIGVVWATRPATMTEYAGIKLGETRLEARARFGPPDWVGTSERELDGEEVARELMGNHRFDEFSQWVWDFHDISKLEIRISFDKTGAVIRIYRHNAARPNAGDPKSRCPPIDGVSNGSSEEFITERLGAPEKRIINDFSAKYAPVLFLDYPSRHVLFELDQDRVQEIQVYKSAPDIFIPK